ncbi:hypothetical protein EDB85DRAFT_2146956 [Lactarius pseudohatsudake]|nr:hypothetical protein EDB85DRAFT_2146956 [Lactarius pseudohatsudake]
MASLMAVNFSGNGLDQVLGAHLNSLAISPQAKQVVIPALLGIAKFTEGYTQARNVAQPQAVIEQQDSNSGIASATPSDGAYTGYEMHQQSFNSSSGSGYTTGHLYVHFDTLNKTNQYWILGVGGQWESIAKNVENPLNHDWVLSIRSNGEPSWVTRATINTTEIRREKGAKS